MPQDDTTELPISDQVEDALHGLGETSDEVAQAIRASGVKGARAQASSCPITLYLKKTFPEYIFSVYVYCHISNPGETYYERSIPVPQAVYDFIQDFDAGAYDDLRL